MAAEQQATGIACAIYQYFFYPPVYLLLCAPLALLPYYLAYAVFEGLTPALFTLVMRTVLRERGVGWLAPLLAFPAVWWTLGEGQNAFLTAALLGCFTLLIDTRPARRRPLRLFSGEAALSAAQPDQAGGAKTQQAQRGRFRDKEIGLDRQ